MKSNLALINHLHPFQSTKLKLVNYQNQLVDEDTSITLDELLRYIDGLNKIIIVSAYRSSDQQAQIYNDSLLKNGLEFTKQYVARPLCSEHQSGLAIDLSTDINENNIIDPEFIAEGIGLSFMEKMANFGFILRYPKEKETITNISHEPWHFRYVGYPHSQIMKEKGLCLEEYIEFLDDFTYEKPFHYQDYLIFKSYKKYAGYDISFDNIASFIHTRSLYD